MKDLNLVPKSYYAKKKEKKRKLYYIIFGVIFVLCFGYFAISPLVTKNSLNQKLGELDSKGREINAYNETIVQFNTIKEMVNQRETEAVGLASKGIDVLTIIEKIEANMPDKMFVLNFIALAGKSNDAEIMLKGSSVSEDDIAAFVSRIRDEGYFSGVDIISVNKSSSKSSISVVDTVNNDGETYMATSCLFDIKVYINK